MWQYSAYFFLSLSQLALSLSFTPLCHEDEHIALMQFKESLITDKNISSDHCVFPKADQWKLQGVDCCSWEGIECDQITGHVISLNLSKSCLRGSINSNNSLFRLVHLRKLDLAYNNFTHSDIPSAIGSLSGLTYLNLSCSLFAGQIPFAISKLSRLSILDLSFNFAYDNPYQGLLQLKKLDIKSLVENLTSLTYLDLSMVDVSSPIPSVLANFSALTSLICHNCKLVGKFPTSIFQLPNLQVLDISKNPYLKGYFPEFQFGNQLKVFSLWNTSFSGQIPTSVGNLSSLEFLALSHCKFSGSIPSSLGDLTKLTHLGLENNSFTGNIPSFLSNFTNLVFLSLGHNEFHASEIPSSLAKLIRLERLDLAASLFTGSFPIWLTNLTKLEYLDLGFNELQGELPSSISRLQNLQYFDLSSNNLSGFVEMETLLELKSLEVLTLSYNNLSVVANSGYANASFPKLVKLRLASCNLTEFPDFLRNQEGLKTLDLSFNNIHGHIPEWLLEMSSKSLLVIKLSHNFLTGFEESPLISSWTSQVLLVLDIRNNKLQGPLPVPPASTVVYLVSDNSLTGHISTSLCKISHLQVLDLSHNNLSGVIPKCLANFSESLNILNLHANNFHGEIPQIWGSTDNKLQFLNLGQNKFRGRVPRSITRCTMLQYLDLGGNLIEDRFPSWLGTLRNLKVLILRSNKFHGTIDGPDSDLAFPELRIVDLSYNEFTGFLPLNYLKTWNAMRNLRAEPLKYMRATDVLVYHLGFRYHSWYNYSMTLTNKGIVMEFAHVSEVFTAIDLSSNRFRGEIPELIGNLKGLQLLNLSNNLLIGEIPPIIGSLSNLEALDLSCNKLVGRIPLELVQLNFLEVFNVSHNHLIGAIPQGGQFDTFDNTSFEGNSGLCGNSLSKSCQEFGTSNSDEDDNEDWIEIFHMDWKFVLIGYGFGTLIGLIMGNIIVTRKHDWFMKTFGKVRWRKPIKSLFRW